MRLVESASSVIGLEGLYSNKIDAPKLSQVTEVPCHRIALISGWLAFEDFVGCCWLDFTGIW